MPKAPTPPTTAKPLRSDGAEARNRLLDAALALFAEKGFAKTSTREIALAAQVNVASISYYFGDKQGLYKAVFSDPRSNPSVPPGQLDDGDQPIEWAMGNLMRSFVEPLKQGHLLQQCMRLHFREMLEPTGVWQHEVESNIKPAHHALASALCRHLGLATADDEIHRLVLAIYGLGILLHIGADVIAAIRPQLLATPAALDQYTDGLVTYAMDLVSAEGLRRARAIQPAKAKTKTSKK